MMPPPAAYETRLNYLTLALFAGIVVLAVCGLAFLPDRIPVHFNLHGNPDRWGKPSAMLLMPILCLFIEALLWAIRRMPPELMNFPGPRTPGNIARQMHNIRQLLATLRVLVALLFLAMTGQWLRVAVEDQPHLTLWLPLVFATMLLVGTAVFGVRAYRLASQG